MSFFLDEEESAGTPWTEQQPAQLERPSGLIENWTGLNGTLREFQIKAVDYAQRAERTFIADEQGLGKTIEAIATVRITEGYPALVLCPSVAKYGWRNHIRQWLPGISIKILSGLNPYPGMADYEADFVISNYDLLSGRQNKKDAAKSKKGHGDMLAAAGFQTVICDESHMLAHKASGRTKQVKQIADRARYVYLLSGTPAVNGPSDLITQLQILRRLDSDFGGWFKFISRYCQGHRVSKGVCVKCFHAEYHHQKPNGRTHRVCTKCGCEQYAGKIQYWDVSGSANLVELNQKLRQTCYIRRTKAEVLPELPPKQRSTVILEIDNPDEYTRVEEELIEWLKEQVRKDEKFLAGISELPPEEQQEKIRERETGVEERTRRAEQIVRIEKLKQTAVRGKMKMAHEWIDDFLEGEEKLIVFAVHRDVQRDLIQRYNALHIVSEDSAEQRQKTADTFQADKTKKIIVVSLDAGGIAITLTAASNVAFVEQGWTPKAHRQAEDRAHRIGQKDSVNCYYLTAIGTIEEEIAKLLDDKAAVVDAVIDGIEPDDANRKDSVLNGVINKLREK